MTMSYAAVNRVNLVPMTTENGDIWWADRWQSRVPVLPKGLIVLMDIGQETRRSAREMMVRVENMMAA